MFGADRAAIAAALSTVDGVTGCAERPAVPEPGQAWPVLVGVDRGPGDAWAATWRLLLVLDGDEYVAVGQLEALLSTLAEALAEVLYVDHAEPVTIETPAGILLGIEVRGLSE
jgi:hypothetical protein